MANGKNAALALDIATAVANKLVRSPAVPVSQSTVPSIKGEVVEAINENPVVQNALNLESPVQSRVIVGTTLGSITGGLATVLQLGTAFGWVTPDESVQITAGVSGVIALASTLYALYGRVATGLKPLFSKK